MTIAKSRHDQRAKKLISLAREADVESKDIQTSALRMAPEYSEDKIPKFLGYQVSQSISITLKDLSKYEALMTHILEAGVDRLDGLEFIVAEPRKYREEAGLKALRAARDKAMALATELGQTIGKPWEISEGDNPYALPVQANALFGYNNHAEREEVSTIAPGEVAIRASIRISFQLE